MYFRDPSGCVAAIFSAFARLRGVLLIAACTSFIAPATGAGERPIGVVELFTSQGCSSCPPADGVFSDLVAGGDVVALSYHVDYWDYLGWRDTLGAPENTARQYEYMKAFGTQSVYTPQAVVNGRKHVNGADRQEVSRALLDLRDGQSGLTVDVKATRRGSGVMIEADAATGGPTEAEVVLVYFDPPTPVEIGHGENSGKMITYWNAVTSVQVAGMWHGKSTSFELPMREVSRKGAGGCAVLLQAVNPDGLPGPILGATVLKESLN
jgi:hypothetical protein